MFHCENNTMETERLLLRPFVPDDAEQVAALCNNENIHRRTLALPYPYTKECAVSWIAGHPDNFLSETCYEFAITDKRTGQLYGAISLSRNKAHNKGEMGYWLGEPYWNHGYATEAAQAVIRFAFEVKGYHRVYARHYATNPASGRVMEKCGMTCEGTLKEDIYKIDRYEDVLVYGILNPSESSARLSGSAGPLRAEYPLPARECDPDSPAPH